MFTGLSISSNYVDPETKSFEIVERKGLGHPDTIADGLANIISIRYSKYCLQNFGAILHHNIDKVYVGGGMFLSEFGSTKMIEPIHVVVNGRMSNEFAGTKIDIVAIAVKAVHDYLRRILPCLNVEKHLDIVVNSTQNMPNMNNPHWYKPRGISDLPEFENLTANDTAICIAHTPMTVTERFAYRLETFFREENRLEPRFPDYGQDIKVMAVRENDLIDVTMCVPVMAGRIKNIREYYEKVHQIESVLQREASAGLGSQTRSHVRIKVNPSKGEKPKIYILGIGSCIEGGEEGLVGRGNDNNGVISIFRPHSVEVPHGKNLKYHAGRVLGYLTKRLADSIHQNLDVKCTVLTMTKNQMSLIPPSLMVVDLDQEVDRQLVMDQVERNFTGVDYIAEILARETIY